MNRLESLSSPCGVGLHDRKFLGSQWSGFQENPIGDGNFPDIVQGARVKDVPDPGAVDRSFVLWMLAQPDRQQPAKSLDYVQKYRRKGSHPYLFTSHRGGVPLDAAGVNGIFSLLVKRCLPHLQGKLHPHILRHTFNNRLMDKALELGWSDDRRNKVQTYLNGWSENSSMPAIYTRRLVEAEAMVLTERYQAELYRS